MRGGDSYRHRRETREYEANVVSAQAECDRLIGNGNISYEKAKVVRASKSSSAWYRRTRWLRWPTRNRPAFVDTAHAEADRLRGECDIYVKLAEFEEFPQRHPAVRWPRSPPALHSGRHSRLRGALTPFTRRKGLLPGQRPTRRGSAACAVVISSLMARQHGPTAQRHVASPMTVDIARLGRRPGSDVRAA